VRERDQRLLARCTTSITIAIVSPRYLNERALWSLPYCSTQIHSIAFFGLPHSLHYRNMERENTARTCATRFPAIPSLNNKTQSAGQYTHSGKTTGFACLLGHRQQRFRRGSTSHHHRVVRVGGLYISDTYASAEKHKVKIQRVRER
jgi:hypothetical protein